MPIVEHIDLMDQKRPLTRRRAFVMTVLQELKHKVSLFSSNWLDEDVDADAEEELDCCCDTSSTATTLARKVFKCCSTSAWWVSDRPKREASEEAVMPPSRQRKRRQAQQFETLMHLNKGIDIISDINANLVE